MYGDSDEVVFIWSYSWGMLYVKVQLQDFIGILLIDGYVVYIKMVE